MDMNNGWLGFSLSPSAGRGGRYGDGGGGGGSGSGDGEGSCSSPAAASPLVAMPLQADGPLQYSSTTSGNNELLCLRRAGNLVFSIRSGM
jgi:AP2-like factor (ANT lineage)